MGSSLPAVTNDGNDGDLEVTELANCAEKPGGNKDFKSGLQSLDKVIESIQFTSTHVYIVY